MPAHNADHGELLVFTTGTVSDTPGSCSEISPNIRTSYMSEAAEVPLDRESVTDLAFQVEKGEEWNGNSAQARCFQYKVLEGREHRGGVCANEGKVGDILRVEVVLLCVSYR